MIILTTGCLSCMPVIALAPVEEIEIIVLESFPVQVQVIARGYLPDPCTEIYQINQEREGNTFFIIIKTYCPPGPCIQVITLFEEIIPLEIYDLPAGTYTVDINGIIDAFEL